MSQRTFLLIAAFMAAAASNAQTRHDMDSSGHPPPHAAASAAQTTLPYVGAVRAVDKEKGKITLRHRPLTDLGMTAMTMEYLAADKKLLEGLNPGDKVKFRAEHLHGAFVLTGIEKTQ